MNQVKPTPLYVRPGLPDEIDNPFDGDLFRRKMLADRLTKMVSRLPEGGVVTIDAPWGEGKTWFGRNWHASLKVDGFVTAYIDCFQHDHIEDPFLMLSGEFLALAKGDDTGLKQKIIDAGKKLGMTLLPLATKVAINMAGRCVLGTNDLSKEASKAVDEFQEGLASGLEKYMAKRLEEYDTDKNTVQAFRLALGELAKKSEKPIVIFLDELDRCRPDFAVKTIERVKHFFEVPGIVFILLLNREQLCESIKGIYGAGIEAHSYLGKFVQLSLTLPKLRSLKEHIPDDNRKFCEKTLGKYGLGQGQASMQFAENFGIFATYLSLGLRDIERGVALYSLALPAQNMSGYLAWAIALKISDPVLFCKLVVGDSQAHLDASKIALDMLSQDIQPDYILTMFAELHDAAASNFNDLAKLSINTKNMVTMRHTQNIENFLPQLFGSIDLSIEV